ncbi:MULTISPECIES: MFS transporter [unclassified Pseudomonas]|uniref:MFS transporter n=1 Tax=unclassified Pseudomonas TaxID=196821 RepID=UPI000BDB37C5|nr:MULTISPECIES: MFS transporter [unclassified Pseudomonas]PVZ20539.1 D-galactonate transporter [Pseudomonas sp. URIL14HWK12:I12]PVZ27605.1 D-galactonate transporter [Pseudomonas sp. URIL14HWK12:I10]PVZ38494.1 D-galactonate transporter [Pseudomonas sp. URIL14HWK12:I11]SNZ03133.1 Major Facilitator Superfamily protein [Pseudomonas sp. URIL14HWK12:I9]
MNTSDEAAGAGQLYTRIAWRLMPLLLLCYVVNYIDRVNIGIAKLQFSDQLGFDARVFGLGAGLFFIGFLLLEVPSNLLLARIGARKTLLRIMLLWGLVTVLTMFVRTPWQFYTLRVLLGAAEAGFFPGIILYLSYWFPAARRARITALFFVAVPVAGLVGSPLSGWIMHGMDGIAGLKGWQWMFLLEGLPAMVLGVVAFRCLDDGPQQARWLTAEERAQVARDLAQAPGTERTAHGSLRLAFREPRLLLLGMISFGSYVLANTIAFYSPTIIHNAGVSNVLQVGLLSAVPSAVGIVAMLYWGRHSDRHAERRWHYALPLFAAAASLAAMKMVQLHPLWAVALLSVATAGHFASLSVFWSVPPTLLPPQAAAAGIAVISSIGALGGAVGPAMLGYVTSLTGDLGTGLQVAAAMIACAGLLMLWILRPRKPSPDALAQPH